ncbi:DDE-type integrase/transposase/recombinase [Paraburkholderia tropica]|uniref:DDE-type integrase/transposase/recombinase n=1 Tax=Paraburkholderia tropica TaxID=92647 RepID=UPI0015927076|nr:DDE-type integrase/transposase/recombinase [Paraburkholderia tropica]
MSSAIFKLGATLVIDGRQFEIIRIKESTHFYLESTDDGAISAKSRDELLTLYAKGKLRFSREAATSAPESPHRPRVRRPLSTYSEAIQERAMRKKNYLDLLSSFGPIISTPASLTPKILECARRLNDPHPPSWNTIYRWQKRLNAFGGDPRALIDRLDDRGKKRHIPGPVLDLLQQTIETEYLVPEKRTGKDVYYALLHRLNRENEFRSDDDRFPMPSLATIYRYIRSIDAYDVTVAKEGKRSAQIKFRTSGQGPTVRHILERVEIDHTPLDLFVIDDKTQLPLGRPYVTVALDVYSRMVAGIYVGFDGPSVRAVLRCLRHAILPKSYIKERYPDIEHDWPCYGQIQELVCDNGLEFHSNELSRVAFELGMVLLFCPKRQPWMKGSVERYLKTLNYQFAHSLPGTSLAKWFHREDYDPLRQALVTHDQLMHVVHRWLVDVYSQTLHRGISCTPYQRWTESAQSYSPSLPESADDIDIAIGDTHSRVLSHQGIELGGLRYNDDALLGIRKKHGARTHVDVIAYFDDVSTIAVIDPDTKVPIVVPAVDQSYARGLTREQHRMLCARAREVNAGIVNHTALAKAKSEIRAIVSELALSRSQKARQRSAKIRGIGTGALDPLTTGLADDARSGTTTDSGFGTTTTSRSIDDLPKLNGTFLMPRVRVVKS